MPNMKKEQKLRPDLNIGKNIKLRRYQMDLTQDQVVAKLQLMGIHITKGMYVNIENGYANIRVSELMALKKILKITSYDYFFSGLSLEEPKEPLPEK